MWMWDGRVGYGWMGLWWIVTLVIIGLIVWFALSASRRDGERSPGETPEQVVKRRYARGEIDRETYRRLLEDLRM
jgi:putative membrane protein